MMDTASLSWSREFLEVTSLSIQPHDPTLGCQWTSNTTKLSADTGKKSPKEVNRKFPLVFMMGSDMYLVLVWPIECFGLSW